VSQPEFTAASFNKFLGEKKLMGAKCTKCEAIYLPPRPMCTKCRVKEMEWVEVEGKGKLAAFTCIAVGSTMMVQEGYGRNNPYCSGVVELEGGQKVTAQIMGVDAQQPESIKIGTPLQLEFVERGEGENRNTYLGFKPA